MIDLGNSTNLSAEEAASSLAKFANVTKMSAKDYDRLGATIVDLGNNFATTEADIVQMATRLAATGELAGLSQPQILSLATAMSSVGIETEAGGSAMSKLLKQIQVAVETGSSNLKDFAKVAGMTSNEFKQAYEKDAVKALSAFISGLNNTKRNGKSAIAVLNDMGLTEVRLSNTILSLANASDVMNNAVDVGNTAWEDNTALTNEANKRYGTLKSQLTTTINKIKDMAITTGNKLMPSIQKIVEQIGKWIEGFNNLNDEQVDAIVKIGLLITALGPATKIIGNLTTTIGGVTKGIGIFVQAIGVTSGKITSTSSVVNNLANVMKSVISPAGLVTTALTGLAVGITIVKQKVDEELKSTRKLNEEIQNSINSRNNAIETINKQQDANLVEIDTVQNLKKELTTLVDENGKVKEGYEARVQFILTELNKALGTEYGMNNDIINSYKNMQKSIDDLILKKKAQIILEASEEKYKEAIKNKTKAYEDYIKAQEELNKLMPEFLQLMEDQKNGFVGSKYSLIEGGLKLNEYANQIKNLSINLKDQDKQLQEYNSAIDSYNTNSQLMIEGGVENLKKIEESVAKTQSNITTTSNDELSKRIANQITANETTKKMYDLEQKYNKDAKDSIYATNVEEGNKNLQLLIDQLIAKTSTVKDLGLDEIAAWKNLAQNSFSEYSKAVSKLPSKTQEQIQKATGVIIADTSLSNASENKANNMNNMFERKLQLSKSTAEQIEGSAEVLRNDTSVQTQAGNVAERAEGAIKSNNSSSWGSDMVIGMGEGIRRSTNSPWFSGVLQGLAGKIKSYIHFSRPDKGPLREYEKWMPDMVKGLAKTLKKSSPQLINSVKEMSEEVADELQEINGVNGETSKLKAGSSQSINSVKLEIDYNKMSNAISKSLTNCKLSIDEDGFARIVKEEIYKVV